MTIIKSEPIDGLHPIESQSHRHTCWLDGYIEVPPHLDASVWATGGYCDLTIEDGVLVGITPLPIPEPEPVPPVIDPEDDRDSMFIDHEYRLTLIELGV